MAIAFGRVKAVLTALGLWGFISASLVHFSKSLWRDPVERWVLGVSIGLLVTVGILIFIERSRRLPEGRASLVPRYDPNADPPRYEVPFHFDEIDCRLGVYNEGPSIARNVVVRVMSVVHRGNVRFMDGFPFQCPRVGAPDDRLINPSEEAFYHLLEVRDMIKESGLEGSRQMGFRFFWQPKWEKRSVKLGVGDSENTISVEFQITAENADSIERTLLFHGEKGERLVGRLVESV